jgi:hypothetical protein
VAVETKGISCSPGIYVGAKLEELCRRFKVAVLSCYVKQRRSDQWREGARQSRPVVQEGSVRAYSFLDGGDVVQKYGCEVRIVKYRPTFKEQAQASRKIVGPEVHLDQVVDGRLAVDGNVDVKPGV